MKKTLFLMHASSSIFELDGFTQNLPRTSLPPDHIRSLPNFPVERDIIQTRLSYFFENTEFISERNIWRVFKLPVVVLS